MGSSGYEKYSAHILIIFHVIAASVSIRASQHFNQGSKMSRNSTLQLDRGRSTIISFTPHNGGSNNSAQVSTNKNPYSLNVVLKYYKCGEIGHKSNICLKSGTINFADSFKVEIEYEELEIEGEVEENFIEFDIGDAMSHSLVVRRLMCIMNSKVCDIFIDIGSSENIVSSMMVKKLGGGGVNLLASRAYKIKPPNCSIIDKKIIKVICRVSLLKLLNDSR
ncbi:unnamed protein product [Spirodela intermedia]|uniref:Uncharacterized protein n=1 Tax=Spirodela intermedia TaxID=51605 RepID=A0A7I8K8Q5_SPIIN|nr:unnamed protein product [Spirodela intermedia]